MTALSGFWLPVFGSTQGNPTSYGSWDATHQSRYTGTGSNRLIWAPQSSSLEDDILDWIVGGAGRPTLAVNDRKSSDQRLRNLASYTNPLSQVQTEDAVEAIIESYDNDGYSDAIWGYIVNHEDYEAGTSPYWTQLGWVVDKIASLKPGKAIIAVGYAAGYGHPDVMFGKLWAADEGLLVAEAGPGEDVYAWRSDENTEWAVLHQEDAWRAAADKSTSISTGNANKWMGIVSCHREVRPGGEFYYYPSSTGLLYTALGPIAHGGEGTLFYLFESGWDTAGNEYQGVYGDSTRRGYVTSAISRMEEVEGYLHYSTFQDYAHGNDLPGSWNLDSVSSGDPSNPLNILEVCRATGPDGETLYALCNRDPDNSKSVSLSFDSTYYVYLDGVAQGNLSSLNFSISSGNARVIKLE